MPSAGTLTIEEEQGGQVMLVMREPGKRLELRQVKHLLRLPVGQKKGIANGPIPPAQVAYDST